MLPYVFQSSTSFKLCILSIYNVNEIMMDVKKLYTHTKPREVKSGITTGQPGVEKLSKKRERTDQHSWLNKKKMHVLRSAKNPCALS
jgi:hypothetical protein